MNYIPRISSEIADSSFTANNISFVAVIAALVRLENFNRAVIEVRFERPGYMFLPALASTIIRGTTAPIEQRGHFRDLYLLYLKSRPWHATASFDSIKATLTKLITDLGNENSIISMLFMSTRECADAREQSLVTEIDELVDVKRQFMERAIRRSGSCIIIATQSGPEALLNGNSEFLIEKKDGDWIYTLSSALICDEEITVLFGAELIECGENRGARGMLLFYNGIKM